MKVHRQQTHTLTTATMTMIPLSLLSPLSPHPILNHALLSACLWCMQQTVPHTKAGGNGGNSAAIHARQQTLTILTHSLTLRTHCTDYTTRRPQELLSLATVPYELRGQHSSLNRPSSSSSSSLPSDTLPYVRLSQPRVVAACELSSLRSRRSSCGSPGRAEHIRRRERPSNITRSSTQHVAKQAAQRR